MSTPDLVIAKKPRKADENPAAAPAISRAPVVSLAEPEHAGQHPPRSMAVLKASAQPRNQRVLLAEDESMIRELIATFLTNLGFTVVEAENGRDSLEQAKKLGPDNVHLLITDLVMPVMGGLELAAELRKLQPELRVLFISGYTDDVVILGHQAKSNTAFLKKPFSFETLRHRVETLLADES